MPSPYSAQKPLVHGEGQGETYSSFDSGSLAEGDLSLAFRGMVVADDSGTSQQQGAPLPSPLGGQFGQHPSPHQIRAPPQVQQPRAPYSGFPQTDYTTYYSGPSAPVDYQYSYDAYRPTTETLYAPSPALTAAPGPSVYPGLTPQSLHPHAVPDIHNHQSGIFYDYAGSPRPMGSQYYYPTQPMLYHAPPTHSPMLDKKRDIHVR
ncbi:hypothetical protein DAEQUDRAFT_378556 [Daedalea quercina L-15889]|uniref:Uncharacterized protein n=1 Tax=Daedalea quercina L-15889 TaxID=1314783 RepID=A0A165P3V1_9APHY|nr:hypothetical protein DAEQUDRAFT_378556 [Daedalea quercina L-15889]